MSSRPRTRCGAFELVGASATCSASSQGLLGGRLRFDDAHVTVRVQRKLPVRSRRRGVGRAAGLVERLREVKDEDELRRIAAAAELADEVYGLLRERAW